MNDIKQDTATAGSDVLRRCNVHTVSIGVSLALFGVFLGYCLHNIVNNDQVYVSSEQNEREERGKNLQDHVNESAMAELHVHAECSSDPSKEYSLDAKDGYELLVLCAGFDNNQSDEFVADDTDSLYLKLSSTNEYLKIKSMEYGYEVGTKIAATQYPRIYLQNCYEGCGPISMIELNQGPNYPLSYFDITQNLYRNEVEDFVGIVGGKVIVAGYQKIAEFDPMTFNTRTLLSVGENESISIPNEMGSSESSVVKVDESHVEYEVHKRDGTPQRKILEIK